MMHDFKSDSLLVRYLLGEASPEECSGLEAKYLADADLFEELEATEDDLIDAYARGQLPEADHRRFEEYFLVTPERRQRAWLARALLSHVAAESGAKQKGETESLGFPTVAARNRWPAAVQLVALVFIAATVAWSVGMTIQNLRLQKEVARLQAAIAGFRETERALQQRIREFQANKLSSEGNGQNHGKATSSVAVLTLNSGIPRGNGPDSSVVISSGTRLVRLYLASEDHGYSKLNATLETLTGKKVWQAKNLTLHGGREAKVDLTVPANILANGDYIVNLTGSAPSGKTETMNSYAFRVVRR
jgi:hypothetical protein